MEKYVIPNLRNACLVLKYLSRSQNPCTLREISESLKLPRTTAMRILTTLTVEGFAKQNHQGFALGSAIIPVGAAAKSRLDIREIAKPALSRVTERTEETSHLAVPSDNRSLIVEVETSPHPLSSTRDPGSLLDLHCSATGKCFLAFTYWPRIRGRIQESDLVPHTRQTITSVADLTDEIKRIRKDGYAVDEQEQYDGVRCLAVPVYDSSGKCIASLGVSASATRFTRNRIAEFSEVLFEAARDVSTALGHAR